MLRSILPFGRPDATTSLFSGRTGGPAASAFAEILASRNSAVAAAATAKEASPVSAVLRPGRNPALADPESAYRMMTEINRRSVIHRAEHARMRELGDGVRKLGEMAARLGEQARNGSDDELVAALSGFTESYNAWGRRHDADVAPGGLLAGTQAAGVARWELGRSIGNIFHGAAVGLRGMAAAGLTLHGRTDNASFDAGKARELLAGKPQAARALIGEFAADMARGAQLLNSERNFIPTRLDNLDRAIRYIDTHLPALQAEFGIGDPYQPASAASTSASFTGRLAGSSGHNAPFQSG